MTGATFDPDAVISRVGLIYFPDQVAALTRMRAALRPRGRIAAISHSTRSATASSPCRSRSSAAARTCRRRCRASPARSASARRGVAEDLLARAGFSEVEVRRRDAPLRLESVAEYVRFARESFGALHQMLARLDGAGRAAAWEEIERALERFAGPDGFAGPCELVVAAGTA